MKWKNCLASAAALAVCCTASLACKPDAGPGENPGGDPGWTAQEYYSYFYPQLGDEVMPIGAWCAPPASNFGGLGNPNFITAENYKTLAESGLNSIYALYDYLPDKKSEVVKALEYAADNDVVYLARNHDTALAIEDEELFGNRIDYLKDYPAFGGFLVQDEPGTVSFSDLAKIKKTFDKLIPDKTYYVNMMPNYASGSQLVNGAGGGALPPGDITYEKYVDRWISTVKPPFFSYDYYGLAGKFPNVTEDYYNQMSMIREKTLRAKIPFWVFIQSCSFNGGMRIPTAEETAWQVSTSLAYGAKGIQYFTYWTPIEVTHEVFNGCMVSAAGAIQPTYYMVQKENKQIAAADAALMKSASMGVMTAGSSPAPVPEGDVLKSFRELVKVEGESALVGCFDRAGKTVLYVASNTVLPGSRTVTLTFDRELSLSVIQGGISSETSGKSLTLTLSGGEGALVSIK